MCNARPYNNVVYASVEVVRNTTHPTMSSALSNGGGDDEHVDEWDKKPKYELLRQALNAVFALNPNGIMLSDAVLKATVQTILTIVRVWEQRVSKHWTEEVVAEPSEADLQNLNHGSHFNGVARVYIRNDGIELVSSINPGRPIAQVPFPDGFECFSGKDTWVRAELLTTFYGTFRLGFTPFNPDQAGSDVVAGLGANPSVPLSHGAGGDSNANFTDRCLRF